MTNMRGIYRSNDKTWLTINLNADDMWMLNSFAEMLHERAKGQIDIGCYNKAIRDLKFLEDIIELMKEVDDEQSVESADDESAA